MRLNPAFYSEINSAHLHCETGFFSELCKCKGFPIFLYSYNHISLITGISADLKMRSPDMKAEHRRKVPGT